MNIKHVAIMYFLIVIALMGAVWYVDHIFATKPVCLYNGESVQSMYVANEMGFFKFAQQFGDCTVIDVQTSTDENPSGEVTSKASVLTKIITFIIQLISKIFGLVRGIFI